MLILIKNVNISLINHLLTFFFSFPSAVDICHSFWPGATETYYYIRRILCLMVQSLPSTIEAGVPQQQQYYLIDWFFRVIKSIVSD